MPQMQRPLTPSPLPSPFKVILCMPLDVLDMASVCMWTIGSPCNGHNGCLSLVNKFA
tara:strand:- start:10798 stop:10968 length:171 start_codon:yes stop_codon:yes gene_type:complete